MSRDIAEINRDQRFARSDEAILPLYLIHHALSEFADFVPADQGQLLVLLGAYADGLALPIIDAFVEQNSALAVRIELRELLDKILLHSTLE